MHYLVCGDWQAWCLKLGEKVSGPDARVRGDQGKASCSSPRQDEIGGVFLGTSMEEVMPMSI